MYKTWTSYPFSDDKKLDVKKQKHHILTIWKKKSAEASNYFQCKPAEGCSGTIEPKRLADTLQSCVHG